MRKQDWPALTELARQFGGLHSKLIIVEGVTTHPELPPTVGYAITCTVDSTTEGRQGIGFQRLYELLANAPKPRIASPEFTTSSGPEVKH